MPKTTGSRHYTANMIGSHAESQQHIHSINKCNDPNLACVDFMIVQPAKLYISCKPNTFCSAALIASGLCLTASTRRGWCCWMKCVLIVKLTWHFISILPVRFTPENVISSLMWFHRHWFPYGKGLNSPSLQLNSEEWNYRTISRNIAWKWSFALST